MCGPVILAWHCHLWCAATDTPVTYEPQSERQAINEHFLLIVSA